MRSPAFVIAARSLFGVGRSLALIALSMLALLLLAGASAAHNAPLAAPATSSSSAVALTERLAGLGLKHGLAAPADRAQLASQLLTVALQRGQLLSALMESDPAEVLRLAVPAGFRAGLPASVQAHVEEQTQIEGTLEVLHEDYADGTGRYVHALETAGGRLSLHFAADAPELPTGTRVRAAGVRLGGAMALDSGGNVQALALALPNTFGAQRTLVILVNFQDKATQPYTPDYARGVVFSTTSAFDVENSFGQTWLTGDVTNWYTIGLSSTVCDYTKLASLAKQAAAANFNVSGYARLVYGFPQNACSWWGLGSVGGNPSQAWINGSFVLKVVGHEMGHNLGLYHSRSMDCGSVVLGDTCTVSEYGDTIDIMGNPASGHFTAFQKERLGWLDYGVSPPITTVESTGLYALEPYAAQSAGTKALKVLQSTDPGTGRRTWYYVEYRQPVGFDGFLSSNSNVKSGVVLHLGTEGSANSSYLLDLTPATSSWSDPALAIGQSYDDASAGVTITPLSVDATGAQVNVTFGPVACVPAAPAVTASPSATQWTTAGATVSYTLTVTNNDNGGCSASTFTPHASPPVGWSATLGPSGLVISPGASASTSLQLTSPVGTANGLYSTVATAGKDGSSTQTASVTVSQMVVSAIRVSVSTSQASYTRNSSATVSALVTSTDSATGQTTPVQGASVAFTITKPGGATVRGTATTGASGVASYQYKIKPRDAVGTWAVQASATFNGITATGSGSFTVK